jgi:arginyl-tRNA synthetase
MFELSIADLLTSRVRTAMSVAGCGEGPPVVQPAGRPEHGDYQVNGVMAAAKALRVNPRGLAQDVVKHLSLGGVASLEGIASRVEIAGPGFINISLSDESLAGWCTGALGKPNLGVPAAQPLRVVIDYSSPNLAKEMHVGHLRSTIIGDALARVLRFLGHTVIAQNHVGDWGTQFGMLTAQLDDESGTAASLELSDLEAFYRQAKQRFDSEPAFADRARDYVVKLQSGDARVLMLWRRFLAVSSSHCEEIYRQLGVQLVASDIHGESAYNQDLPLVVADLEARGLVVTSEGAKVVFLQEFKNREGEPAAYIVQKQDGGFLYSTTDLAAVRHRVRVLAADRVLYVVDARQTLHFQQLFALAHRAGFAPESVRLEHVGFGMVLGDDGKPFKTRSGDTVKLADLLREAKQRAAALVAEKNPGLSESEREAVSTAVGIGAIKYFDLSKNRATDYVFHWDGMLAFEGNTAPYLQYAYTRALGVCRRAGHWNPDTPVSLGAPAERQLALQLARFAEAVHAVANDAMPHYLCTYLYALAGCLMRFYEACPVLTATDAIRGSRLQLCRLTADTLRTGLDLLGITVMEAM